MDLSNNLEFIAIIALVVAVISIIINFVQLVKNKKEHKEIISQMQMHYNNYNYIAHADTRARRAYQNKKLSPEEMNQHLLNELGVVRGIADSSRVNIISYSREQLGYLPFFEHPAFPGIDDFSDEIILGIQSENDIQRNDEVLAY